MAITSITSGSYLGDTIIYLRDFISSNVTDPFSGSRAGNEKFVYTAYPKRTAKYPIITIVDRGITDIRPGGMRSEIQFARITVEIRVWARNVKERDELTQSITDNLRTNQYGSGSSTETGLFDYSLGSVINVDESGEYGVKSKIIHIEYSVALTS